MPRLLVDRCGPDTIREFRRAAECRRREGVALQGQGYGTAAIYLWGYAAEMTLKAAYFTFTGVDDDAPITLADLQRAVALATGPCGIAWPPQGRYHNLVCWARLLVGHRLLRGAGYSDPRFVGEVLRRTAQVYGCWRETLRYHDNVAYGFEVAKVRSALEWLLDRRREL